MADNTNVNNNSAVVVVGRTAPVPPGQQKSEKSIPVVIANDQSTIPVAEQNKVQSEVALSLLGIPRSEVALGIFADVNTYDVNPTEWTATPEQYGTTPVISGGPYEGVDGISMGHGLTHIPEESGAMIEAPADKTSVLTSKRFFRYQPGRVSAATFGVKTTLINDNGAVSALYPASGNFGGWKNFVNGSEESNGVVANPAVRKYGIFDKYDGYYWESRNNGEGDNFSVVRRTQSLTYDNPLTFGAGGLTANPPEQSEDYGRINPSDPLAPRGSESEVGAGGSVTTPPGFEQKAFGDLVIVRDNLMMTHAGVYDPSLLQPETKVTIDAVTNGTSYPTFELGLESGVSAGISNAEYDINSGIMVITTQEAHGFHKGKYVTLAGIAMTCDLGDVSAGGDFTQPDVDGYPGFAKIYPNNNRGYNILEVPSSTTFKVNVGVSTVPTYYSPGGERNASNGLANGWVVGLSTGQYVSYSAAGGDVGSLSGMRDTQIYKVRHIGINTMTGITTCSLNTFDATQTTLSNDPDGPKGTNGISPGEKALSGVVNAYTRDTGANVTHGLVTPVPFIQPLNSRQIDPTNALATNIYGSQNIKTGAATTTSEGTGMFPYQYTAVVNGQTVKEGFIDTTLGTDAADITALRQQIDLINTYYKKWVNMNVDMDYWNVYEFRVPRSRFSGDRLDGVTDNQLYSDTVGLNRPGDSVKNVDTGELTTDLSAWNLDLTKVTMYKIEFSWYGAVGALFLAYVPVGNGEARWLRVHHLRASNQLKISSLGNATLPITYMIYGGGGQDRFGYRNNKRLSSTFTYGTPSEHIVKYGASYYIDGGDRGTVKLFSQSTNGNVDVYGSKRSMNTGSSINVGAGVSIAVTVEATGKDGSGNAVAPHFTYDNISGLGSSFYVGASVVTGNPLDQNVEVSYIDTRSAQKKVYLNVPLNSTTIPNNNIDIIPKRVTPLIGLKCKDFIKSSTGIDVRNRTQVYPTRMSSGSTGLTKIDFLKSPVFQTDAKVTSAQGPVLEASCESGTHAGNWNIGKRGKPTKVKVPMTTYVGNHTWNAAGATLTNAFKLDGGASFNVSSASYDSATGVLTITAASGSFSTSNSIRLLKEAYAFTCNLDSNATVHKYPRDVDPSMDLNDADVHAGGLQATTGTEYLPATGIMTVVTTQAHGLSTNDYVNFAPYSLKFKCDQDGNDKIKSYPRPSGDCGTVREGLADPAWKSWLQVTVINSTKFTVQVLPAGGIPSTNTTTHAFQSGDANGIRKKATLDGLYSKPLACISGTSGSTIKVRINNTDTNTASAAEYIRDIGTGTYGWFRGYFKSDVTKRAISVLGYLENRGSDRSKGIEDDGYYFYALNSTADEIMLFGGSSSLPFLREENSSPEKGVGVAAVNYDFEKEGLSSVKVSPQFRSPIPGSGTVVASVYSPQGGEEYDLAPYFDYNKEYLSFPLTNKVESLYLCSSSQEAYDGAVKAAISASLTWEEQ